MRSGNNDPMAAEIALKSPLPPPFALTRLTPMWVKLPAAAVREHLNSRVTRKLSLQVLAQGSLLSLDNEQVLNDLLARFEFAGAVPPRTSSLVHIVSRAQGLTFLRKPDRTTCGLERYQLSALPPARSAAFALLAPDTSQAAPTCRGSIFLSHNGWWLSRKKSPSLPLALRELIHFMKESGGPPEARCRSNYGPRTPPKNHHHHRKTPTSNR